MKRLILWLIRQQWFIDITEEDFCDVLKQWRCQHEFQLKDLKGTGIPEPEKPKSNDFHEWGKYLDELYRGESFTKRVQWPCRKCGKTFYAHCGLDIAPKHGYIV